MAGLLIMPEYAQHHEWGSKPKSAALQIKVAIENMAAFSKAMGQISEALGAKLPDPEFLALAWMEWRFPLFGCNYRNRPYDQEFDDA